MGNKCCQIEEVASILNIIKALVENVSTSISTQTAITTIQQYINNFNGNLISGFRLESDNRTITIELANGNTFPLILDRVTDVRLDQAGTEIIVTHSDPSLSNTIPLPTFNGLTSISVSNPSNVNLSGDGTALDPLKAEAIIEHQDSSTISISGDGTSSNPLIAEYIGPSFIDDIGLSNDPNEWDILKVHYSNGPIADIILPIRNESFQLNVPVLTKNGFDGFIPLSDFDETNEWILDDSNLIQYDLNNNAIINGFDDTFNRIFRLQGRAKIALEVDTGIVANKGGLTLLDLTSTAVPIPSYNCKGTLTGRYTVLNGIKLESYPISGEVLMNTDSNKLLMYLSFVEYSNMNGEFGYISFNISYNY